MLWNMIVTVLILICGVFSVIGLTEIKKTRQELAERIADLDKQTSEIRAQAEKTAALGQTETSKRHAAVTARFDELAAAVAAVRVELAANTNAAGADSAQMHRELLEALAASDTEAKRRADAAEEDMNDLSENTEKMRESILQMLERLDENTRAQYAEASERFKETQDAVSVQLADIAKQSGRIVTALAAAQAYIQNALNMLTNIKQQSDELKVQSGADAETLIGIRNGLADVYRQHHDDSDRILERLTDKMNVITSDIASMEEIFRLQLVNALIDDAEDAMEYFMNSKTPISQAASQKSKTTGKLFKKPWDFID